MRAVKEFSKAVVAFVLLNSAYAQSYAVQEGDALTKVKEMFVSMAVISKCHPEIELKTPDEERRKLVDAAAIQVLSQLNLAAAPDGVDPIDYAESVFYNWMSQAASDSEKLVAGENCAELDRRYETIVRPSGAAR